MPDNIFQALRESHERQRALCKALRNSAPQGDGRQQLFCELRREEAAHAAAEERFLYAPILMADNGLTPSRHALAEHHKIEELFEELAKQAPSARGWMQRAKTLCEKIEHHLEEEESRFFQQSGKILGEAQKTSLTKSYRRDYQRLLKSPPYA